MEYVKINVGDTVAFVQNGVVKNGTVLTCYDFVEPPVFAVKTEEGNIEKMRRNDIYLIPKKEEPVEERFVTITEKEFEDIALKVIFDATKNMQIVGIECAKIVAKIKEELFFKND